MSLAMKLSCPRHGNRYCRTKSTSGIVKSSQIKVTSHTENWQEMWYYTSQSEELSWHYHQNSSCNKWIFSCYTKVILFYLRTHNLTAISI